MENVNSLKRFFKSKQMLLSDAWLDGCLQWIREENPTANFTEEDVQLKVYEQWLLLDLRDVEIPSLPPNLQAQVKLVLEGNYSLQLMYVVDISKPKYMQLQKIRNSSMLNDQDKESKVSANRVLQLTLSDGVQEVIATEYTPIPALNINLTPGIKVRLMGPVTIRRGRIMLQEKNIKILGGEVEDLLIPNAAENVLARTLQLQINPNPRVIEETFEMADKDLILKEKEPTMISIINKTNHAQQTLKNDAKPKPQLSNITPRCGGVLKKKSHIDDRKVANNSRNVTNKSNKCKSPDLFEDMDFESYDFDNIDSVVALEPKSENKTLTNDSSMKCHDIDKVEFPEIHSIRQIVSRSDRVGTFKVKAKFKCVTEKLSINDGKFSLKISIDDDTEELIANVHSDLLLKLSGCTAAEVQNMNSKSNDPAKIIELVRRLRENIRDIDCMMDIQYNADDTYPTIVKLYN